MSFWRSEIRDLLFTAAIIIGPVVALLAITALVFTQCRARYPQECPDFMGTYGPKCGREFCARHEMKLVSYNGRDGWSCAPYPADGGM